MPRKVFTALDALKILAPPPARPLEQANPWAWPKIEHQLGLALPDDYRRFAQAYGSGCFSRLVWVLNPAARKAQLNLLSRAAELRAADHRGRSADPLLAMLAAEESPSAGSPHPDVLMWAFTDAGHRLYWWCDGNDPNAWPTMVYSPASPTQPVPDRQLYPHSMTEFLYEWLQTQLTVRLFGHYTHKTIFEIRP